MQTTEATTTIGRRAAPGPRAWPVLGNVGVFRGLLPFMEQQWALHGDVTRVHLLGMRALLLANPDHIQRVLIGQRHNYVKAAAYDSARKILGDGLVTLEGSAWKERRTLAQPAFHRVALEKLTAIMVDSGAAFLDRLDAKLGAGPQRFEVHHEMVRLTLDVVINALFGRGTLESSEVSYDALQATLELLSLGANGFQLPEWVPTPTNRKFKRTMRAVDANVYAVLEAARKRPEEGTLLAMLLAARDEHGQPLSDKDLRDEVITLFFAGHETTALTLTWLFALLDAHPEVISRMREEVDSVLAGREPSFADIPKLPYLRQVVEETLRLRPPAAMIARNAVAADEVGGYAVEAGDTMMPFIWGAHRHPDHWQDPQKFDPERFTPSASKGRHPAAYMPFSIGPRICIGNSFTMIETTVLLAQLINRFEIEIQPAADVKPVAIATVRPSRSVFVRLARRRRAS
jgi:cytochrome P450